MRKVFDIEANAFYYVRGGYRHEMKSDLHDLLPLSTANIHILLALAAGDRHGYAIMKEVGDATKGAIKLGPGTLYRSIDGLLKSKLIEESSYRPGRDEDQRRKYYRLTALGRRVLADESERLARVVALARARKVLQRSAS